VARADMDQSARFSRLTRDYEKAAAALGLPAERVHQCPALGDERTHVEEVGAEVEDRVILAEAEVVNRAGVFEPEARAEDEVGRRVEAVEVYVRPGGREGHAEVEDLAGRGVELRVGGERA